MENTSQAMLYRLIFGGKLVAGFAPDQARRNLQTRFKLTAAQIERLFSGAPVTIKKCLSLDEAKRYQVAFLGTGLVCNIVKEHVSAANNSLKKGVGASVTENRPEGTESSKKDKAGPCSTRDIDAAIAGSFPRVPVAVNYRLGVFCTAFLMMFLPAFYVLLMIGVGYGMYVYASAGLVLTKKLPALLKGLIYVTPLLAGAVLLLFMAKPLLAKPYREYVPVRLDPVRHRVFFHFVERVCGLVGARVPSEIRVDCNVNASASLRGGVFSNELVLTVGMPLIMGLNTRDLAGVLAHEFGHFAQHAGMKMGYVISSINGWLYRVVRERDAWDYRLERLAGKSSDFYVLVFVHMSRLCIYVTRRILSYLMLGGVLVSRYMSRQMEFDADRYEARLAGSAHFARTSLVIHALSNAFSDVSKKNAHAWDDGHVVDNLPAMVASFVTQNETLYMRNAQREIDACKTGIWDTHPAPSERIRNAQAEQAPGVFDLDVPARRLLAEHERLCKIVTLTYYRDIGINITSEQVVPLERVLQTATQRDEGISALENYFNGWYRQHRFIPLPVFTVSSQDAVAAQLERVKGLIGLLRAAGPEISDLMERIAKAEERFAQLQLAGSYLMSGKDIDPKSFGVEAADMRTVEHAQESAMVTVAQLNNRMEKFERMLGERLVGALQLASMGMNEGRRAELSALITAVAALGGVEDSLFKLRAFVFVLSVIWQAKHSSEEEGYDKSLKRYTSCCDQEAERILGRLDATSYSFAGGQTPSTLAQMVRQWIADRNPRGSETDICIGRANAVLDAVAYLNLRITGTLARYANEAEAAHGIQPIRLVARPVLPRED